MTENFRGFSRTSQDMAVTVLQIMTPPPSSTFRHIRYSLFTFHSYCHNDVKLNKTETNNTFNTIPFVDCFGNFAFIVQYKTRISSISSSNNSNSNSNITQRTNRKGLILTCLHSRTVYGLASQQTRLQTKFVSITQSPMFNLCSLPPVFNI